MTSVRSLRPSGARRVPLRSLIWLVVACWLGASSLPLVAADVSVQPASGSGFVVKNAAGTSEWLRVQESSGAVSLPGVPGAATQATGLCMSSAGLLGPCSSSGPAYAAATGLSLSGTTFSVAPTYQLPQSCSANQVAQWNGSAWICANLAAGGALPAGTVNQTLRYDGTGNAWAANSELQVFADGGVLATDAAVNAAIAGGTTPSGAIPASGAGARMMWYPAKGAFRVGYVGGTQWDDGNIGLYSVAMGDNTTASGNYSTAMGASIASGDYSTAMGASIASESYSTAMGEYAKASAPNSTAMGGYTTASGVYSTAMGNSTTASGSYSTAMGSYTTASGIGSTAMGVNAYANEDYSFVWNGDSVSADHGSSSPQIGSFLVYAPGGIYMYSGAHGSGGCVMSNPGSAGWACSSDRELKTNITPVDARAVLAKVVGMPVAQWSFKAGPQYRHIGPMAQDFKAAFDLGDANDKFISASDAQGVALAAIQGLNSKLEASNAQKDAEIARLSARVAQFESLASEMAAMKAELVRLKDNRVPAPLYTAAR
ncbi:MAG: tail fiber domain-containing protein [Proteobacteria bacterium]|nr:tail fiber domain-containing protein [Pseudomonadota bacterium]